MQYKKRMYAERVTKSMGFFDFLKPADPKAKGAATSNVKAKKQDQNNDDYEEITNNIAEVVTEDDSDDYDDDGGGDD